MKKVDHQIYFSTSLRAIKILNTSVSNDILSYVEKVFNAEFFDYITMPIENYIRYNEKSQN